MSAHDKLYVVYECIFVERSSIVIYVFNIKKSNFSNY